MERSCRGPVRRTAFHSGWRSFIVPPWRAGWSATVRESRGRGGQDDDVR